MKIPPSKSLVLVGLAVLLAGCLDEVPSYDGGTIADAGDSAAGGEPGQGPPRGSPAADGGAAPAASRGCLPDPTLPDCTQGTCWYVDSSATGNSADGTSWQNAWKTFGAIAWNQVSPGDTVFISGGATSKTYNSGLTVGASGNASKALYIRAGQDPGHNGVVKIAGLLSLYQKDYVTIDGGFDGQRHIVVTSGNRVEAAETINPTLRFLDVSGTGLGINATYGSGGEFSCNYIHDIRTDAAIRMNARNINIAEYDQTSIHHNEIQVNSVNNSGTGPDGIQTGWGVTFHDNFIYGQVGTVTGGEHQDLIQTYGTRYHKVYNNTFLDSGDAMFGDDSGSSTSGNVRIWNNVFRSTTGSGTTAIRFYNSNGNVDQFTDILIDNNTFVDMSLQANYGAAIQLNGISGTASVNDVAIRNNLFFNCGRGYQVMQIRYTAVGIDLDYNLLSAGGHGNTDILYAGFGGQAHGQSGTPAFVSYAEGAQTVDLHLATTDAAARDKGQALSGFSTDKDAVIRPQGSAWDIGAYEVTL